MASRAHNLRNTPSPASGAGVPPGAGSVAAPGFASGTLGKEWIYPSATGEGKQTPGRTVHLQGGRWVQFVYVLIDTCCVSVNGVLAFLLRFAGTGPHGFRPLDYKLEAPDQPVSLYAGLLLLYVTLIVSFCEWQDLYRTPRTRTTREESLAAVKAVSLATLLLTAFLYLSGAHVISRKVVASSLLLNAIALATWRFAKRRIVIWRVERGIGTRNALIVGAGSIGQALARLLQENKLLGYEFKGFLDANHSNAPYLLGKVDDLPRVVRTEFVDTVFITTPSKRGLVKRIAAEGQRQRLDVKVVPELYDGLGWHAPIQHVGDFPVMDLYWLPIPTLGFFAKRTFDLIASFCGLVVCFPILLYTAIHIKFDSPGPVIYRSSRVGRKGRVFCCYKLRTMVANADDLKDDLRSRNERSGPCFKISDDPRLTRLGKFLRKYSIDELPQLWNVFKGDMSVVGPRPHPLDDFAQYSLQQLRRLEVKPGMTGLWQVTSRQDPSFEANMRLDLHYIENWTLLMDLRILWKSLPVVWKGLGQ